ncbi:MAG: hypothetical protein ABIH00_05795 [Armatimonadota bacterium]
MQFYGQTIQTQQWLAAVTDYLTANSTLVTGAAMSHKYAYDNWQMLAKTQFGILNKQQDLHLGFVKQQDAVYKKWEGILGG